MAIIPGNNHLVGATTNNKQSGPTQAKKHYHLLNHDHFELTYQHETPDCNTPGKESKHGAANKETK